MVGTTQDALSIDDLVIGVTSGEALYDDRGILLIAAGVEITASLIDKLRCRGITVLHVGTRQTKPEPVPNGRDRQRPKPEPTRQSIFPGISPNYSEKKVRRIRDQFAAGEKAVAFLYHAIKRSGSKDLRRTDAHVEDYINELIDDPDPVVANALAYDADLELAQRCVQFSVLSMAIGQHLDLPSSELRDLGSAALVHDWSLFDLPAESRFPHQAMTDEILRRLPSPSHHHGGDAQYGGERRGRSQTVRLPGA